jgi:hypothetical protein
MYSFKIDPCPRRDPHDWEQCLYAHRGEKARRRHPSKYEPVQCPEARAKTLCPRGDECPCTHNLFEYWCGIGVGVGVGLVCGRLRMLCQHPTLLSFCNP